MPLGNDSAYSFFEADYHRTLFPLNVNRIVIEHAHKEILRLLRTEILARPRKNKPEGTFLPQQRVYAAKSGQNLRRTVKLDPVAEFFLYDLVYANRARFTGRKRGSRIAYGYSFERGVPIAGSDAYAALRAKLGQLRLEYRYFRSLDIASYFNSLYHHDLEHWFNVRGQKRSSASLGTFLREINSGRSVDCLPQGLYPAKVIGSHFLGDLVDQSKQLRCARMVRFMDDIYLFDNSERVLTEDYQTVQKLLGEKALSVNTEKSRSGYAATATTLHEEIDDVKVRLLQKRRETVLASGDEEEQEEIAESLTEEEHDYLLNLVRQRSLEEDDAELGLSLMRETADELEDSLISIFEQHPSLAKAVYRVFAHITDKTEMANAFLALLRGDAFLTEFQLFWLGMIVEEYLLDTRVAGDLLIALFEHAEATPISQAKILEIAENRFGMPDLRTNYLRSGQSDWLAWAAAVGSRCVNKAQRNQVLKYFKNASMMNRLISDCVRALP